MWEIAIVALVILFALGYVVNKIYKGSRCCGHNGACIGCPIKKK